ncbi:MAG TPA: HWE histidine kinase domain-containing protein [Beijerinckiaceae bacterium]|nr:HWE histidine kinase domain-containing protein [Beijerinckiaceae bacterium]
MDDSYSRGRAFLEGGGETGAQMRGLDWSQSPLGAPETWPQSLRAVVSLLLNSKFPMFVAWGPELGFLYNDPYAPILGTRHPAAQGRRFRDIWPEIWDDISPLVERALAGEASFHEDLPLTMQRRGYVEETYFTFSYSPVRDESGGIAGMFCACTETTGAVLARRALRAEKEHLRDLFVQAPGFMAVLRGPDHVFEITNAAYQQLVGDRDLVGKPAREALPDIEGQGFFELLDRVYRSGEPFVGREVGLRLQRGLEGAGEEVFVDFVYQPIHDATGTVTGIFVEGSEVTERVKAQRHQRLLIDELNHRVKNTLATVQSIVFQTLRNAASLGEANAAVERRLIGLSGAHDVLTRENWEGADFGEIVGQAIDPFKVQGRDRFLCGGPAVRVPPRMALAFAMALQELATNAVKYGALSNEAGRVEIAWSVDRVGDPPVLHLHWRERGGPPVAPPARRGFGTRLVERSLAGELDGDVRIAFEPDGVECTVAAPLDGIAEDG